jgi:hypothetical protein
MKKRAGSGSRSVSKRDGSGTMYNVSRNRLRPLAGLHIDELIKGISAPFAKKRTVDRKNVSDYNLFITMLNCWLEVLFS